MGSFALDGVREDVRDRAFQYWRNVDEEIGERIETKVRAMDSGEPLPGLDEGVMAHAVLTETKTAAPS